MIRRWVLALLPLLGGCRGAQSMLEPAGPAAAAIATIWWWMFWGSVLILALVMALVWYAVYRRPERRSAPNPEWLIAGGGVVFPTVVLTVLLIYGYRASYPFEPEQREPLVIEVTGHTWWWEVRYPGQPEVITANEIRIPVGRTVRFRLHSSDVIHSFWVPRLGGKLDMVPGTVNVLDLRADEVGRFRGQCAEFCGAQHARMAFWVVVETEPAFESWLAAQGQPGREPTTVAQRRGRDHFLGERCIDCHTIRGTPADATIGPDLTHVGSRLTLAAGTLVNNRENIARWIADNSSIKPGNLMADFSHLDRQVIEEMAIYLESLQ